jgi:hypothetical protein
MKAWAEMSGEALTWTQLRAGLYSLRGGEGVYAQLRCQVAAGSLATGEAGDERWTLKRIGLQRPRITVRRAGEDKDVAVLRHSGRGEGVLELADGRRYAWKATRLRRREKGFYDADGELVMRFSPQPVPGKVQARVELAREAAGMAELPLLALVGWYRMLIELEDQAGAAATSIARRMTGGGRAARGPKRLPPGR